MESMPVVHSATALAGWIKISVIFLTENNLRATSRITCTCHPAFPEPVVEELHLIRTILTSVHLR